MIARVCILSGAGERRLFTHFRDARKEVTGWEELFLWIVVPLLSPPPCRMWEWGQGQEYQFPYLYVKKNLETVRG